jgi:hypothetical protein
MLRNTCDRETESASEEMVILTLGLIKRVNAHGRECADEGTLASQTTCRREGMDWASHDEECLIA